MKRYVFDNKCTISCDVLLLNTISDTIPKYGGSPTGDKHTTKVRYVFKENIALSGEITITRAFVTLFIRPSLMGKQISTTFQEALQQRLPIDQCDAFLEACRKPLKKSISINTHRLTPETLQTITTDRGRTLTPSPFVKDPTSFYIDREDTSTALGNTFFHQGGFFYMQELAASLPATQLDLQASDIILDMAAAPGGKTFQLATTLLKRSNPTDSYPLPMGEGLGVRETHDERKNEGQEGRGRMKKGPGLIIANDVNPTRIKSLAHNLNKTGCYNTALTNFNGFAFGKNLPNFFDHVLLDAPCSGEGTGFKSDAALKHRHQAEINKIAGTQFQLLVSAIKSTKPGGTILYSTCTINPYENEQIIQKVLDFFEGSVELLPLTLKNVSPGLAPIDDARSEEVASKVARLFPHREGTGGFFVSKLRKISSKETTTKLKHHKLMPRNQFKLDTSKSLQKKIGARLATDFGIKLDPTRHWIVATKKVVYLTSPQVMDVLPHLNCEKIGIPIAKIDRDQYRPTHYLGNILGDKATKNVIVLTDEQMQRYAQGENLLLEELDTRKIGTDRLYTILQRNGYGLSTGKQVKGELKNKFLK